MSNTTNTITVTKRNGETKTVESPYSKLEVLNRLATLLHDGTIRSDFAWDLFRKEGAWGLSEKQLAWVHVLVVEAETKSAPRNTIAAVKLDKLVAMLDGAVEAGTRFPKIRVETESGQRVVISRAGDRSKNPGTLNVTDGRSYGENVFFGRVHRDGSFESRTDDVEVVDLLVRLDQNPSAVGRIHGKRTGSCCFCGRDLETRESVAAGYGPVCAAKFGLDWGSVDGYAIEASDVVRVEVEPVERKPRCGDYESYCSEDCAIDGVGCGGPFRASKTARNDAAISRALDAGDEDLAEAIIEAAHEAADDFEF